MDSDRICRRFRAGAGNAWHGLSFFLFFVFLLALLCPADVSAAAGVRIDRMNLSMELGVDGNAALMQETEFRFVEDSTYVDLSFYMEETQGLSLKLVEVGEGGISDARDVQKLKPAASNENTSAMTYLVQQSESQMDLRIYMPAEAGSRRLVRLQFIMNAAVAGYEDVADFHFTLPPAGVPVGGFSARIRTGSGIGAVKSYAYGSNRLESFIDNETGAIVVQDDALEADESVRIRGLYPPELVSGTSAVSGMKMLDQIIAEENANSSSASWLQVLVDALPSIRLALMAVLPILVLTMYLPVDWKRFAGKKAGGTAPDIGTLPPPIVGLLIHRHATGHELTAALYDLAARGGLRIDGDAFIGLPDSKLLDQLTDYDRFLMQWMTSRIGENGRFTAPMVTQAAMGDAPLGFHQAYGMFRQLLRAYSRRMGLVDRNLVIRGRILGLIYAGLYAVLAVSLTLVEHSPVPIFLFAPAALFGLLSLRIRRLTPFGNQQLAVIRSFRTYIRHARSTGTADSPSAKAWSRYLPYAVALGEEKAYFKSTERLFTLDEMRDQGLFAEYGMTYRANEDRRQALRHFQDRLKGNAAAFLTATLYAAVRQQGGDREDKGRVKA